MTRLLLASNSTNPGQGYLDHLADELLEHFAESRPVAFVPYALHDLDGYASTAKKRFEELGLHLVSIHESADPAAALLDCEGIFVGGGNTFRLLERMMALSLIGPIRVLVRTGVPYLGTSAGSNVACPSITTTNDMPIVQPPDLDALGLVDFQINPHYVDRDPDVPHGGETRQQRIMEFHEENSTPVIGLREGSWLSITDDAVELRGPNPARLFRAGAEPRELQPGPIGGFL